MSTLESAQTTRDKLSIRASCRLLVEADHIPSLNAEPRSDLGRVPLRALHDSPPWLQKTNPRHGRCTRCPP